MEMTKREKSFSLLCFVTAILAIAAFAVYIICSAVMKYYSDFDWRVLVSTLAAIVLCGFSTLHSRKNGKTILTSIVPLAVTVLLVFAFVTIIRARLDSFAWLVMSDLERANQSGYIALYTSICSVALYILSTITNAVAAFR